MVSSVQNQFLSFHEFYSIDSNELDLSVNKINSSILKTTYEVRLLIMNRNVEYTINKRYNEFAGFYDTLTIKYKNLNFPEFPSKFQLFNKEETRKNNFSKLLQFVLTLSVNHREIKRDLMKILYEFLFPQGITKPESFKPIHRLSVKDNPKEILGL